MTIPTLTITCDCRGAAKMIILGDVSIGGNGALWLDLLESAHGMAGKRRGVWRNEMHREGVQDGVWSTDGYELFNVRCPRCRAHLQRNADQMAGFVTRLFDAGIRTVTLRALVSALP